MQFKKVERNDNLKGKAKTVPVERWSQTKSGEWLAIREANRIGWLQTANCEFGEWWSS